MAKGGFRPGGGRPPALNPDGTRKYPIRVRAKPGATVVKAKRVAATPPKRGATPKAPPANPFMPVAEALAASSLPPPADALVPDPVELPDPPTRADVPGGMAGALGTETPLEYMLRVMNEPGDDNRRDKLAIAAAPFVHVRAGEVGKKTERQDAAKKAGAGKFGAAAPPRLVASNP